MKSRERPDEEWEDTPERSSVSLRVAAELLGMSTRAVRARLEDGRLDGWRDGRLYRITLESLMVYEQRRRFDAETARLAREMAGGPRD